MSSDGAGYTGDVVPGGPADVRELPGLRVTKLSVGTFDNNVYLLRCAATGDTVLVDGAAEPERILAELGSDRLVAIVQTHGHWDHVQAIAALRSATGAPLRCHAADVPMMPTGQDVDVIADGDLVPVGTTSIRAIHLEGHTPGGLAFVYDADGALADSPHLFSGDSLFPGGPGRTTTPEDFDSLMSDLQAKVFGQLPDETWFYPGHGKDSTLGAERAAIPEWLARRW